MTKNICKFSKKWQKSLRSQFPEVFTYFLLGFNQFLSKELISMGCDYIPGQEEVFIIAKRFVKIAKLEKLIEKANI